MTLTTLCISLFYPIMAFIGLLLMVHVFDAPYLDTIDFIAFFVTLGITFLFASWGIALNYGVETL